MKRLVAALVFLSVVWPSLPRLRALVNETRAYLPLSVEERRERKFGEFFRSLRRLQSAVPPDTPLAILLAGVADVNAAVLLNYYLYPQPTRLYMSLAHYRLAVGDPKTPKTLVRIDSARTEEIRLVTYASARQEEFRGRIVVKNRVPSSDAEQAFVVPLMFSVDGPAHDSYVMEAVLANPGRTRALVDLTWEPLGLKRQLEISPGATVTFDDFAYELYQRMDIGWLRLSSSVPIQSAFWFVNRGINDASPLPIWLPRDRAANFAFAPSGNDPKLWLVNRSDETVTIDAGETIELRGRAFQSVPMQGKKAVEVRAAPSSVIVFATERDSRGATRFFWPVKQ